MFSFLGVSYKAFVIIRLDSTFVPTGHTLQQYWEYRKMFMYMIYSITDWLMSTQVSTALHSKRNVRELYIICAPDALNIFFL